MTIKSTVCYDMSGFPRIVFSAKLIFSKTNPANNYLLKVNESQSLWAKVFLSRWECLKSKTAKEKVNVLTAKRVCLNK